MTNTLDTNTETAAHGVTFLRSRNRHIVRKRINGRRKQVASFKTEAEAVNFAQSWSPPKWVFSGINTNVPASPKQHHPSRSRSDLEAGHHFDCIGQNGDNGIKTPITSFSSQKQAEESCDNSKEKQPTTWWSNSKEFASLLWHNLRETNPWRVGNLVLVERSGGNSYFEVAVLGTSDAYPFSQSLLGIRCWPFATRPEAERFFKKKLNSRRLI